MEPSIKVQVWDGRGGVRHLTISQRSFLEAATGGALVRRIVETDQALGTAWKRWKASSERDQEDSDNLCPSEDDKTLRLNQSKDQRTFEHVHRDFQLSLVRVDTTSNSTDSTSSGSFKTGDFERIIEDFEDCSHFRKALTEVSTPNYLKLAQNPIKYEMVRRPWTIFDTKCQDISVNFESISTDALLQGGFSEVCDGLGHIQLRKHIQCFIDSNACHSMKVEAVLTLPEAAALSTLELKSSQETEEDTSFEPVIMDLGNTEVQFSTHQSRTGRNFGLQERQHLIKLRPKEGTKDPTSEGRSVVMNFGNDKHSFNCWLSAIRMGIFGRKKLKDSFEGLSTAAANSPVSSKSKEGVGLGDFRLFSKFGKLRLMAGGGTKKSEAIDMPRATSDPASLTSQPMASSFVSMPGKGGSGRLVGFHRDSTCGIRKTSNTPAPASSSGHRRHRQASENFDKVFVAGGGSSVAASTPPSTKRDPSITSSSSSSGLMTLTTASSGSSKWSLGSKPPDYHQWASNRSSQGDDSFFGADLGYNEYDNPCDRLLPPCGSPSSQSNSGIPESPATSPTTSASNYHQTDEVFVAVDRSEGEFKVVTDPAKIEEIRREEVTRRQRAAALQARLSREPWYCNHPSPLVSQILDRVGTTDGYFLVRSSNYKSSTDPDLETFALNLTYRGSIRTFRIIQRRWLNRIVCTIDNGTTQFPSLRSLVEFYRVNQGPLPCLLTDHPLI